MSCIFLEIEIILHFLSSNSGTESIILKVSLSYDLVISFLGKFRMPIYLIQFLVIFLTFTSFLISPLSYFSMSVQFSYFITYREYPLKYVWRIWIAPFFFNFQILFTHIVVKSLVANKGNLLLTSLCEK